MLILKILTKVMKMNLNQIRKIFTFLLIFREIQVIGSEKGDEVMNIISEGSKSESKDFEIISESGNKDELKEKFGGKSVSSISNK